MPKKKKVQFINKLSHEFIIEIKTQICLDIDSVEPISDVLLKKNTKFKKPKAQKRNKQKEKADRIIPGQSKWVQRLKI